MEYRVLGALEVLEGERPIPLRGEKQRSLLAILLTRGGHLASADWLIDELWCGAPPDTAAAALRVHITGLRSVLEPDRRRTAPSVRLPLVHPGYRLTMGPNQLDAQRFERALVLGRKALSSGHAGDAVDLLDEGMALWRGPPYADIADISCVRVEVQRLEELRVTALEDLFEGRLALGEHAGVVDQLAGAVATHPLRERFTAQLVLALYRCERQADALRALAALRSRLLDELGIDPSPPLTALERDILQQRPELAWSPPNAPLPPARKRARALASSFVGRSQELIGLGTALEAVVGGASTARFIGGAPGVGKTALCVAFGEEIAAAGATLCYGRCDAEPVGPYQPFAEALRSLLRQHPLPSPVDPLTAEVARLVPELVPIVSDVRWQLDTDADTDRYRLFEAVASLLRVIPRPVVLVLDDLQWADPASVLLLRHLVRHDDVGRLLLVGAYRDSEVEPGQLFTDTMNRLVRDGVAERLSLAGLDAPEVESLIRGTARADVLDDALALAPQLQELTGGNPFFLCEVLQHLGERGARVSPSDLRELVPSGVRDLVAERLARLSDATCSLLRTAAVVGPEFDLQLLAEATGSSDDVVLEAVEEALGERLVEESASGVDRFSFAHAIVRNALYRELPASRRIRVHRDIGEALERLLGGHPQGHLMELARHFLEAAPAGAARTAAIYAAAAAGEAEASFAFEDALDLCRRGLAALDECGDDEPPRKIERCDLLLRLGRAESLSGRDGARATLLNAFDMAAELGDADRMASAVLSLNRGFFARMGRTDDQLVAAIERAASARPRGDDPVTAELLATLASELVWAEDGDRRFTLSNDALAMARRLGDDRTLARVLLLRNLTISAPDTLHVRSQECEELFGLAEQLRDPTIRFQAAFHRSGTALEAGDTDTADRLIEVAAEVSAELRQPSISWLAEFMRVGPRLGRARIRDAEELAHRALRLGQRAHRGAEAQVFFAEQLLEIRRWQDRLVEMLDFFVKLAGVDGVDFGYALLRYLLDAGEIAEAGRIYEEVMQRITLPPRRDLLTMTTLSNLSYVAARVGDADGADALYDALLPSAGQVGHTTVARPVGHHSLGLLAATMDDLDRAEHHLAAAVVAHEAMGFPLLLAESRFEWAALIFRRRGDRELVDATLAEVRATADGCGAAFLARRCDELVPRAHRR